MKNARLRDILNLAIDMFFFESQFRIILLVGNSGTYKVDEDYSFVEFIPTDIRDQYKIVGTSFENNWKRLKLLAT